jgi:hypothetical protein
VASATLAESETLWLTATSAETVLKLTVTALTTVTEAVPVWLGSARLAATIVMGLAGGKDDGAV